jgi:hypothetical protein
VDDLRRIIVGQETEFAKEKVMFRRLNLTAVVALGAITAFLLAGSACSGAVVFYPPPYTSYYVPATAYYAPPPAYTTYYAPPVTYAPAVPYATYYAPPVPYATYYAPPVPYASYYAAPAYVAYRRVAVGPSMYGTPKVYVAGQPVRNALRAVTP